MHAGRKLSVLAAAVVNGLIAAHLGSVAFDFWNIWQGRAPLWRLLWPDIWSSVAEVFRWPHSLDALQLIVSLVSAAALTPPLWSLLGHPPPRRKLLADAVWGILFGILVCAFTVGGTATLTVFEGLFFTPPGERDFLAPLLTAPMGFLTGLYMSLLFFPVLLPGGALLGLLNGYWRRRSLPVKDSAHSETQ